MTSNENKTCKPLLSRQDILCILLCQHRGGFYNVETCSGGEKKVPPIYSSRAQEGNYLSRCLMGVLTATNKWVVIKLRSFLTKTEEMF